MVSHGPDVGEVAGPAVVPAAGRYRRFVAGRPLVDVGLSGGGPSLDMGAAEPAAFGLTKAERDGTLGRCWPERESCFLGDWPDRGVRSFPLVATGTRGRDTRSGGVLRAHSLGPCSG